MTTRIAKPEDLPRILSIYARARTYMKATGNPTQWGDYFPPEELTQEDIRLKRCIVAVDADDTVHGVFAFLLDDEPQYHTIEQGAWRNDDPYGTIHRLAGDGEAKGVFAAALAYCLSVIPNLRADTHRRNLTMQHLLETHGFVRCGIVHIEDGTERIAYQYTEK